MLITALEVGRNYFLRVIAFALITGPREDGRQKPLTTYSLYIFLRISYL